MLEDNDEHNIKRLIKCPEVEIKINNISVIALIDTGSEINALSEEWFLQHRDELGSFEILRMHNTVIKGAVGNKSKNIRHQILIKTVIGERVDDCVFVIVPDLIRDCIIGIELLDDAGCILDLAQKQLTFTRNNKNHVERTTADIMIINIDRENSCAEVVKQINQKVEEIKEVTEDKKEELR